MFKQTPRSRFTLSRAYESCLVGWKLAQISSLLYVSRCYSSAVITTFSGIPEHWIMLPFLYVDRMTVCSTKAMRGINCKIWLQSTIKVSLPFFPPPPSPFPSRARLIFAFLVLTLPHYTIWEPGIGNLCTSGDRDCNSQRINLLLKGNELLIFFHQLKQ